MTNAKHELTNVDATKKAVAEWVKSCPDEVRNALFEDKCELTFRGETQGDRNETHWRHEVVVVTVNDGLNELEWEV